MKIMMSSCLVGEDVMYWGGNFLNDFLKKIIEHPEVELFHFCPEHFVLGTPRNNMIIHGGDGKDIWNGTAKLLDTSGKDCTEIMKSGSQKMLELAREANPDLIILTEGSDSCGSQVIIDSESENNGKFGLKPGVGVATALLQENGFTVVSHENEKQIYDFLRAQLVNFPELENLKDFEIPGSK